jgi:ribulose kinase
MDFMSFFPGLSGGGTCEGETLQHFIERNQKREEEEAQENRASKSPDNRRNSNVNESLRDASSSSFNIIYL